MTTVAVLGTGIMGAPMARHLARSGFDVRAWNRTIEKARPLADDGVTAHVVTDSAATADTLSQGGDDLRRSFESAGVNLISLNIEARGEGNAPTQDRSQDSSPRSQSGARATETDAIGDTASSQTHTTSTVLPEGTLVNVLA